MEVNWYLNNNSLDALGKRVREIGKKNLELSRFLDCIPRKPGAKARDCLIWALFTLDFYERLPIVYWQIRDETLREIAASYTLDAELIRLKRNSEHNYGKNGVLRDNDHMAGLSRLIRELGLDEKSARFGSLAAYVLIESQNMKNREVGLT